MKFADIWVCARVLSVAVGGVVRDAHKARRIAFLYEEGITLFIIVLRWVPNQVNYRAIFSNWNQ